MIQWAPSLATGHPTIDDDHQKLIAALNDLEVAIRKGADTGNLIEILSFLICYTREHFTREEALMEAVQCSARAENAHTHAMLLNRISSSWVPRLNDQEAQELACEIRDELTAWIKNHILCVDCKLRGLPKVADAI